MIKNKGLGRGLDALLGGSDNMSTPDVPTELDVAALAPGKYQPRVRMDEAALSELTESIRAQGMMQPILVRKLSASRYEIIAGERRWRAARLAGLARVPVLVRDVPDEAAAAMSLIENIQREDLNPLEEARGIQRLIDEFKMTHEGAAKAIGRSRSAVTNLLRLATLAKPVQEMLLAGEIDMGHGRALLGASPAAQQALAREAVAKQLSVRQVEKRVQALGKTSGARPVAADPDVSRLAEELSVALGVTATIKSNAQGSGRLSIQYASLDQLDDILKRLRRD